MLARVKPVTHDCLCETELDYYIMLRNIDVVNRIHFTCDTHTYTVTHTRVV